MVADVVDRTGEVVDVVAVERGHERPVQEVDELARHAVALVLRLLDLAQEVLVRREVVEEPDEELRDADGVLRRTREESEELPLLRNERNAGHDPRSLGAWDDAVTTSSPE